MKPRVGSEFLGVTELPWAAGVHKGPDAHEVHMELEAGTWTFTGVSREYTLYSACALNHIGLPFDPVALYWEEAKLPAVDAPLELESPRKLFDGLPPEESSVLYACPKQYADGLIRFLDRLSVSRSDTLYDSVRQVVPVVDWPLLAKTSVAPPKPPTVMVNVYGVQGGGSIVYWRPPADAWKGAWTLVRRARAEEGKSDRRKPRPDKR